MSAKMFNKKEMLDRIGPNLKKNKDLFVLEEVEAYLLKANKKYGTELDYDVIANEVPYFDTLNYTEFAGGMIIHPLCQKFRVEQMEEAFLDDAEIKVDYVKFLKEKVTSANANKYSNQSHDGFKHEPKDNLVILLGSNKLKDHICLNKLRFVSEEHKDEILFKPHPITTHQLIGEIKDIFGEDVILDRSDDLYYYMSKAKKVYTTHLSESAMYAVALDIEIEQIDVYNMQERGSYYHINKHLFQNEDPKNWINKAFNSHKSGVINPMIDENWKEKIDKYLDYIHTKRGLYKNVYITTPKKKK
jgi:hypothetical protein